MKFRNQKEIFARNAMIAAIVAAFSSQTFGMEFEIGDGWKGNWISSISLGSSWRMQHANPTLYGQANGQLLGLTNGTGNNTTDEGELNYQRGDQFSTPLKFFTEVEIKKGDAGMLLRGKAWYDYTLIHQNVRFGNQPNGWNGYSVATNTLGSPRPLSDAGFDKLLRFQGIELLDAYVYNKFEVGGKPLQVRLGNEVLNWGESLFIQGVNQINPIDVPSYRKPGAELKEVFMPVPMVSASQSLGEYGTLEGFYQFHFKATPIEAGCGNYWSVAIGNISPNPAACNSGTVLAGSNPYGVYSGLSIPTLQGRYPKNRGDLGLAYHINVRPLDTELGLYAMKIDARIPTLSAHFGNYSNLGTISPVAASWDYVSDMKVIGMSAATNLHGWSIAGELSRTIDFPAQIDGNDLLYAALGSAGLISPGHSIAFGPAGNLAVAAASGNHFFNGGTPTNKSQINLNAVKVGNGILGADQYVFVAEVGFQWNSLPDYRDDPNAIRYSRAFIFGPGSSPSYGGSTCGTLNISVAGCQNDGYVTPFSWGYRVKGILTYNNTLIDGLIMQPSIFFSQDVKGYSVDSQFLQDRRSLGLGTQFTFNNMYSLDLAAVFYNRKATYDPLSDRAYFSANFKVSF